MGRFVSAPLAVVALILLILTLTPATAKAHAFLERSDPEANDVLAEVPESVEMWFTEPLEVQYSAAQLYDADGQLVETDESVVGPDPYQLTLPLPADLPNGTYSVQWRNVSTADGHPQTGYLPFTIGGQADVVTPTPPAQVDFSGPPAEVDAVGRWLSLLGVAGVVGSIVAWFWVVSPSLGPLTAAQRDGVGRRVRNIALTSVVVAIAGSFVALAVQVSTVGSALSVADTLRVISDTRFGFLWSIRIALLLTLGIVVALPHLWKGSPALKWASLGLAGAVMLPFALNSHAAAPGDGRAAAVVADWIHLGASSVWVGGLLTVLAGVVYATRGAERQKRRETFALVVPRFSTLAIASVIVLAITGFYASWLQVGNLFALTETSYGQTLMVKLGLTALLIALGAVNLLVIGPRLRRAATSSIHFGRTVAAEVVVGVLVLFMVGLLTSLPTARETIAAESGRTVFHIDENNVHVSLYVSPGAVGTNLYTADFGLASEELPEGTHVILRTTPEDDLEGVREAHLLEVEPGRYEATGSELSVVGDWNLELILRRPGEADWRTTVETTIQSAPPEERAPGPAPRFTGTDGAIWMVVLGTAVVVVVVGLRRVNGRGLAAFGAVLLVVSVVGLGVNREYPGAEAENPVEVTEATIAHAEILFAENCTVCHGPEGEGDGEFLAGRDAPNADLTAPHLYDHTEAEIYAWISQGVSGTPMPGFEHELTSDEIWHLVNYVYYLNEEASAR